MPHNRGVPRFKADEIAADPLSKVLLAEGLRRRMTLDRICEVSGLSRSTLLSMRSKSYVSSLRTIYKLAGGVGARLVVRLEDGTIVDPLADPDAPPDAPQAASED